MESIKVTPEELRSQAAKVDQEADGYYGEYRGLLSDVETLTSTDWKGDDANAFKDKVHNFEPDFNKMKQLMNEYAKFLRQAADNYEETKMQTMNTIKGLR